MDLASGPKNGADHDDVDLNQKLEAWEKFYNLNRPHGAFAGKTPYEVLRTLLN
jgi:transposase InsO family protein